MEAEKDAGWAVNANEWEMATERNQCYIGVDVILMWGSGTEALFSPSEALLWGRSDPRSPPTFGVRGGPRGPPCLCMLLFPLHAQTPSPPRCARRGLGRLQASQAAPGSRRPWRSAGGIKTPTGSGLDLRKEEESRMKNHHVQMILQIIHLQISKSSTLEARVTSWSFNWQVSPWPIINHDQSWHFRSW